MQQYLILMTFNAHIFTINQDEETDYESDLLQKNAQAVCHTEMHVSEHEDSDGSPH